METEKRQTIQKSRKLVIVGHPMSGRRTLLLSFVHKKFLGNCCPIIFDTPVVSVPVNEKTVHLALFDTCGQEDFDRLRPLVYPGTNVVLICFSVDNPLSARNAIEKWASEIQCYCQQCPVILVACKIDLRTDAKTIAQLEKCGERPVSRQLGKQIARQIQANAYIECSAKTGEGVEDLLIHAARLSMKKSSSYHLTTCQCILS